MTHRVMFCVGAAKAGTSWLHRALSDHEGCHFRSIKELHYFDALDAGRLDREIAEVTARRDRFAAEGKPRRAADCEEWLGVLRRGEDAGAYLGYLSKGTPEGALVGDLTPAYALLSEERLGRMARIGPDVRFVYLLRDPVARLWSHVRMIAGRRAEKGGAPVAERAPRVLDRTIRGKEGEIAVRGDYASALGRLSRTVEPGRLCVAIYETLFTQAGLERIGAFLGLSGLKGDAGRRVHASPEAELSEADARRAGAWLADQYDFVASFLGYRPEGWRYDLARV